MKYYNKLFVFALSCAALSACSDINDINSEGAKITDDQKQETVDAVPGRLKADLTGIYHYMGTQYAGRPTAGRDDDFGYATSAISLDLNASDMVCDNSGYNWFSVASQYTDRNANYANPVIRYAIFYNQIKLANDLIASIDPNTDNEQLKSYLGQAKAVRAFDYLNLAPYYQFNYASSKDKPCVPLVTEATTNFTDNPRATVEEVYKQIMDDLNSAIDLLEGYKRDNKSQIDQQIAYGLRARANLYMGNYKEAAEDADKALAGYTPASREDVSKPYFYSINESDWMWGILINTNDIAAGPNATWPSQLGSFSGNSYTAGVGCYKRINSLLFNKIPNTDIRKQWWVHTENGKLHSDLLSTLSWTYTNSNKQEVTVKGNDIIDLTITDVKVPMPEYTNVKFGMKSGIGSGTNNNDWCLMRAEEMILIKAEGLAMSGDLSAGKAVLENFVKTYRDPSYVSKATTAAAFQNEVWFQRRVELWGEGFSMADIMRLNKPVVRFHSNDKANWPDAFRFNIPVGDPYLLMRFTQTEMNNNKGIVDNTGGSQPVQDQNPNITDGVTD